MTQLEYKCMDDWYNVTQEDIHKNGGGGLPVSHYKSSPSGALQSIYPEHDWMLAKSKTVPQGYWEKKENHIEFFDRSYNTLGYKCMDDWYNVTQEDIHKNGGRRLLVHYYHGSPSGALQSVYSEH